MFSYTIIIPTKCTRFLLLKSQDITICNFVLYFNNKKRVHFVGIIIVQLSTCTERQQLKKQCSLFVWLVSIRPNSTFRHRSTSISLQRYTAQTQSNPRRPTNFYSNLSTSNVSGDPQPSSRAPSTQTATQSSHN
jgi:hypothetical protein